MIVLDINHPTSHQIYLHNFEQYGTLPTLAMIVRALPFTRREERCMRGRQTLSLCYATDGGSNSDNIKIPRYSLCTHNLWITFFYLTLLCKIYVLRLVLLLTAYLYITLCDTSKLLALCFVL